MSQKEYRIKKQPERLRQVQHSQKSSASANESHASKKEKARLTAKLYKLAAQGDQAQDRSHYYWNEAKKLEAQGKMELALEQKVLCEEETKRARYYYQEMKQVEEKIDRLMGILSPQPQKKQNYVTMKVQEPPSDNQE